jgi:hypothetical protein
VGRRDSEVGLKAEFKESDGELRHCFFTDPFPLLRGKVRQESLDACFMGFKINFFLGTDWGWKTKRHFWKGDKLTEYEIWRR